MAREPQMLCTRRTRRRGEGVNKCEAEETSSGGGGGHGRQCERGEGAVDAEPRPRAYATNGRECVFSQTYFRTHFEITDILRM